MTPTSAYRRGELGQGGRDCGAACNNCEIDTTLKKEDPYTENRENKPGNYSENVCK